MAMKLEDVVLNLELNVAEVNAILFALSKQSIESSMGVWSKIKQSAESQIAEMDIEGASSADAPAE